jgi:DNA-binding response OmpR family regulator
VTISSDYQKEVIALRKQIEELKEQVRLLSGTDASKLSVAKKYKITKREACLLVCLANGGIKSQDHLLTFCDGHSYSLMRVHINRLRHRARELKIKTHFGIGYSLEEESLKAVRKVIQGVAA